MTFWAWSPALKEGSLEGGIGKQISCNNKSGLVLALRIWNEQYRAMLSWETYTLQVEVNSTASARHWQAPLVRNGQLRVVLPLWDVNSSPQGWRMSTRFLAELEPQKSCRGQKSFPSVSALKQHPVKLTNELNLIKNSQNGSYEKQQGMRPLTKNRNNSPCLFKTWNGTWILHNSP